LEGEDLEEVLRRGAVETELAVDWVLQACEALAHLNLHHLVHRDIKPANLFLEARLDGSQRLKLVDFGVAKQLCHGSSGGSSHGSTTNAGQLIGSVPYLAPEQVLDGRDVDGRTDVWGLGAVLYELLCGQPAFGAKHDSAVILEITREQQEPLWMLQRNVPRSLSDVVDRCLEKSRADRWPSVSELARALEPFASQRGKDLVPRICAVCTAKLPMSSATLPPGSFGLGNTSVDARAAVRDDFAQDALDRRELPDSADFVGIISSPTSEHDSSLTQRRLPTPRRFKRLARLAGPAAAGFALALLAAWPTATAGDRSTGPRPAQCPQVQYFPARSMVQSTGTLRGRDWNLYTVGTVSQMHEFAPGEAELSIGAAADLAGDEPPHMEIIVDEQIVAEFDVASKHFTTYSTHFRAPGGEQAVHIRFTNDYLNGGKDRNLLIRGLRIGLCEANPTP